MSNSIKFCFSRFTTGK
ncbi:peptide IlvX [Leclercia adecarboxylata]|nr:MULTISPECIES: peptide IlvX [Leclercia]MCZ7840573.1 peptide IlvX [Leclercia adecarboxylata]MDU1060509.1 peptide IlvX [Leclercia adecarboxylata]MDU1084984.1 peptide IlvX [Leclercia adecarboxylata]MDU4843491.1 peptide IlvX [Leclercia adecarboxylata]MEB5752646.1 peptide IlvX [Leclercia adecarboxylata]